MARTAFETLVEDLKRAIGDAYQRNEYAPLEGPVIDAIRAAAGSADLAAVLALDVSECAGVAADYGIAEMGEDWPALPRALMARARSFSGREQAMAIGLAVRPSASLPAPYLRPSVDEGVKPRWLAAIEEEVEFLRAALGSPEGPVRSAAAQAFAHCRNVADGDVARLADRHRSELDPAVQAALLLAIGAAGRRLGTTDDASLARGAAAPANLVRACAAAARAAAGAALDEAQAGALALALDATEAVPAEWGWARPGLSWGGTPDELALSVLDWASVPPLPELLERLGRSAARFRAVKALLHLGGFDRREPPPLGVVLEELSEVERRALAALAPHDDIQVVQDLGFSAAEDLDPFLRAEPPMWLPLPVGAPAGPRRWHLWRIWRGAIHGELAVEAAAEALVAGLDPAALLGAICHGRKDNFVGVKTRPSGPEHLRIELDLYSGVLARLRRRGFDPGATIDALCADPPEWFPTALATCVAAWLALSGAPIDAGKERVLARGVRYISERDVLLDALASRGPELVERVRALAEAEDE